MDIFNDNKKLRLTRRTFAHLLSLPIDFFETTTAGVVTRHMQQLEKIRGFLTGRLFFTGLDTLALFIFLPVSITSSLSACLLGKRLSLLERVAASGGRRRMNIGYSQSHRDPDSGVSAPLSVLP